MFFIGCRLDSMKTASWSEMPGITRTWLTSVVLLVKKQIQGCRTGLCDPRWLCDYLIQKVVFDNRQKLMTFGSMHGVGFDTLLLPVNVR